MSTNSLLALLFALSSAIASFFSCRSESRPEPAPAAPAASHSSSGERTPDANASLDADLGTQAHLDRVMTSASCAGCHPAIYAEHEQNTHGRAYFDAEARLATRGFRREDCVRCHTPRPVFETGIGLTPMQRWTDLEEGNNCMSCHFKEGYDYSRFAGGKECKVAFDPRVGSVQACASCHRIAGTPDQWSRAEHGEKAGNVCLDCHMPLVDRPVALGEPPRAVRSHVFPASRSESQLRKAYAYETKIEGNEIVVRIVNKGAGHNFPTATRQRAVESLVTVRDRDGKVLGTSRMVCRYPYASELAPGQLTMPVGTQIPSGKSREYRVPLPVPSGTVECELFFKLYRPIEDYHPTLSRRLEDRVIPFDGIDPSKLAIQDPVDKGFSAPEAKLDEFFSPEGLVNVARPAPGAGPVEIPEGQGAEDIARLVSLLEFHMPEARRLARERLMSLGASAYPKLIAALGSWSNETFNQAMDLLVAIGEPAIPSLRDALQSPELYVRCHARMVLARMELGAARKEVASAIVPGLALRSPLDRRSAASALGDIGDAAVASALRPLLADSDWDVVSAAAQSLSKLDDRTSVPAMKSALARATYVETKHDLGLALCELGSPDGAPALLDGLEDKDDLTRARFFAAWFSVTGVHLGYEAAAPDGERLEAMARLRSYWAQHGGAGALRRLPRIDPSVQERAHQLVETLGGGTDTEPGGDDRAILDELVRMGSDALPALIEGFSFPSGFADKRAKICEALGQIGDKNAAPFLAAALRDPVIGVSEWACWALEGTNDREVLPALTRYEARILALRADPANEAEFEKLFARVSRTRFALGDDRAREGLVTSLLAGDAEARQTAIDALTRRYGDDRGYAVNASESERREAVKRWMQ
jgi:HEAT repeat protein